MRSTNPASGNSKNQKSPKKYHPKGFEILYEDRDVIVGNKAAGFLTVGAAWNRDNTVARALNEYLRRGDSRSRKRAYVVHRLDQSTTGILIFAKTEAVQAFLKDNWKETKKIYYAVVHGKMREKAGVISSYLVEDDDYVVYSTDDRAKGRLSYTGYKVIKETAKLSLLEVDLLTGRKNQIRVHMADEGHPIVGDVKYGKSNKKYLYLALHSHSISFIHPHSKKRLVVKAKAPEYFHDLVGDF